MTVLFNKLNIAHPVQEFFKDSVEIDEGGNLAFGYGRHFEYYTFEGHLVPQTGALWIAGNRNYHLIRQVFICSSAMEAICFFSVHFSAYTHTGNLLFLATGLTPNEEQFQFIRKQFKNRKIALVMGNDFLGRVSDIKILGGIKQKPIKMIASGEQIMVTIDDQDYVFEQDRLTLNSFEKISGLRSGMRTFKPKITDTFLLQFKG